MKESQNSDEVFSVIHLLNRLKTLIHFILNNKNQIFYGICSVMFFVISYNYSVPPSYFARTTFVLDNDSSDGMGELSSIASLAGINPSSFIDASSLFQIDNIQDLYRSNAMLKKTLLSKGVFNDKSELLINRLAKSENFKKKWSKKNINFRNPQIISREQDSVIKLVITNIKEKHLIVNKPSRKTTILEVGFDHKDEKLAKVFNENLVSIVNEFYRTTKTLKTLSNLTILKREADSIKNSLNNSIQILAELDEKIPNANPLLKTNKIPYQRALIDVQANSAIYQELVKQLEMAKVSHRSNTPLIQIIDSPIYPLENSRWKLMKTLIYGFSLGVFFMTFYFLIVSLFKKINF
jgi:uncharacterized protein involved in exopolysaccharide biosynthesis